MGKIRARKQARVPADRYQKSQTKYQQALLLNVGQKMPPDVKMLYHILQNVRSIRVGQIFFFYPGKNKSRAKRAIKTLLKLGKGFYSKENDYILSRSDYVPDKRVENAMWVAIPFMEAGMPLRFFRPDGPASIGFMTKDKAYIVVDENRPDELIESAKKANEIYLKNHCADDPTRLQYVFIAHHPETVLMFSKIDMKIPFSVCLLDYYYDDNRHFRPQMTHYLPNQQLEREWRINMRLARKKKRELEEAELGA